MPPKLILVAVLHDEVLWSVFVPEFLGLIAVRRKHGVGEDLCAGPIIKRQRYDAFLVIESVPGDLLLQRALELVVHLATEEIGQLARS